ncbi:MAG: chorismate mutase [Candidatus Brocadiae bacterium]|nr:chorismate mutase [Candidatus Brocadiia bacterium]
MEEETLSILREKIDKINLGILQLLNQRFEILQKIQEIKEKQNLPLSDPKRENEIWEKLLKANKGPIPTEALYSIFQQILQSSKQYMKKKEKK